MLTVEAVNFYVSCLTLAVSIGTVTGLVLYLIDP